MLKKHSMQNNSLTASVPSQAEGKRSRYYLGEKYPGVYLTPQEAACLFYSLCNCTSKNISVLLGIHFRTVEYYRDNIRCKLGAISKQDLLNKIQDTNFFKDHSKYFEKKCQNWGMSLIRKPRF